MIWIVGYSKNDKLEKSEAVGAYTDTGNEFNMQARYTMQTVYESNTDYYVYVDALVKTEALVKAQRTFKEYFESQAKRVEECISFKIDEEKEFGIGDGVKVVNSGQQLDTHYIAFGGLMDNAFDNGYRGPFTLGEYVGQYRSDTKFTVIAKGKFDADGKKNMMLYMVARAHEAYMHHSERGANRSQEPLKAFVLTAKGLERW